MRTIKFKTSIFLFKIVVLAVIFVTLVKFPSSAHALNSTVSSSSFPTYPGPNPGSDPLDELFGVHPNVKNNTTIMSYINTYGISNWYEKTAINGYEYVYLLPENNFTKKLVFLNKKVNERHVNNSIRLVKLVDITEELPPLNDSEMRSLGIVENTTMQAIKSDNIAVNPTSGFTIGMAIVSIVILLSLINLKR